MELVALEDEAFLTLVAAFKFVTPKVNQTYPFCSK